MKFYYSILFILICYSTNLAQYQTTVPFLLNQQSPLLYGAGDIGVSIPTHDPAGFYYNPAQLGYYSRINNLSAFFMPDKMNLYQSFGTSTTSSSYGITLGYNFKSSGNNIPLSIGVGFLHNKMFYSYFVREGPSSPTPSHFNENNYSFDCFSIGASYEYYLIFNFGLSLKSLNSVLGFQPTAETPQPFFNTSSGTAYDIGAMVIAPFDKLFLNNFKLNVGDTNLKPIVKATLGYSISNLGNYKFSIDPYQSESIPRTARLGYNINFGFSTKIAGVELPVVDYSFTAETEDILVKKDSVGNLVSQNGLLGDIKIFNNLLFLNSDNNVIIHKGHIFNFFETLTLVTGRVSGGNIYNIKTSGWAVSSEGLFRILTHYISSAAFNYVFNHFNIEYYMSNISAGPFLNLNPVGFAIYFNWNKF